MVYRNFVPHLDLSTPHALHISCKARSGRLLLAASVALLLPIVPAVSGAVVSTGMQETVFNASSAGTSSKPRVIPSPIYGVTLDDVSKVDQEVQSIQQLQAPKMPTVRVVFDYSEPPSAYAKPLQKVGGVAYLMGQIADSSDMRKFTTAAYRKRTQGYFNALNGQVDVWEIGNEINGNWLGTGAMNKAKAAYQVIAAAKQPTALTFFCEGEPEERDNCIAKSRGGDDMFSWIENNFQLNLPAEQRDPAIESFRLGLTFALVSWYPQQCNDIQPNWSVVFSKLAYIFPNSKVGFGEIGTANPQYGSVYEVNLINEFYPLANHVAMPSSYIGGYFWWYFAEEMVPAEGSILFDTLKRAIQ